MKVTTRYQKDYDGGLNDTASSLEIADNEASLLRNWLIRTEGKLTRRPGLTQVGDDLTGAATGAHAYLRSGGGKDFLVMDDDSLKYLNGSTFAALDDGFTAGQSFAMETCPVNDKVYISNEDNTTHSWDRAATTLNSCLTDLGNTKYQANIMRWHKNHMFFLNNLTVGSTIYANSIGWSAINDPDTHDTTNDRAEIPGNGRVITAIDQGDVLVIFKERSIQFLSGYGDASWQISSTTNNYANLSEEVGCIAPRGACRVGNEVWFIDDEGQIRRIYQTDFDAFRKDIICTKIQGTLATVNKSQLPKALAWSNGDFVYFAFPTGSDSFNSLICVFDLIASKRTGQEAWTTFTGITPGLFVDYLPSATPVLYIVDNQSGKIFSHTGDDDDGVAIDARWDGKALDLGGRDRYKRLKIGNITADSTSGDISVDFYASVDGSTFANLGAIETMTTGSRLGPTGTFRLGPTGANTLGGSSQASLRYLYTNGGGSARAKLLTHSIRHNTAGESPIVNTFSTSYRMWDVR